jgi:hypothetical protein
MKRAPQRQTPSTLTHLELRHRDESQIDRLERRLEDGYLMIEARRLAGEDVMALEEFWLNLLHQYEALCDDAPLAA